MSSKTVWSNGEVHTHQLQSFYFCFIQLGVHSQFLSIKLFPCEHLMLVTTVIFLCSWQTGFDFEEASQISLQFWFPKIFHMWVYFFTSCFFSQKNHNHFRSPVIGLLKFLITAMKVCWACFQGWLHVVGDCFKAEIHIFPCVMFPITDVQWLCCHIRGMKGNTPKKQMFHI